MELPEPVLTAATSVLLNDLSCAMLASGPVVDKATVLVSMSGTRRRNAATPLGTRAKHDPSDAAFLGGVRTHALALDSTHYPSQAHLGSAILPALLATAEESGITGSALVSALVAGWETAALVGEAFVSGVMARGLRASAAFGGIGSATSAAVAAGLDTQGIANAIALSVNFSAGLSRTFVDGSDDWSIQLGLSAQAGVRAVQLVRAGFQGAAGTFHDDALPLLWHDDARRGDHVTAAHRLDHELEPDSCVKWRIIDTVYKWYSACNILQAPIALAVGFVPKLAADPASIKEIRCFLNPEDWAYPGICNARPQTLSGALMSAAYCVATTLTHGELDLDLLHQPHNDAQAAHLSERVRIIADPKLPPLAARLEVTLANDRTLSNTLVPTDDTFAFTWGRLSDICADRLKAAGHPPSQFGTLASTVASVTTLQEATPLIAAACL